MSITTFQKLVTVSIWMFNNLLLNKSCGMLPQYKLPYGKLWNLNLPQTMENYGYEPKSSKSLTPAQDEVFWK